MQPLHGCHNERDGVSNHQPHDCLLNRLFRRRSKKTSKFRVTGLCVGNSSATGEFPAQRASYAEDVSIWWRHRGLGGVLWQQIFFHIFAPNAILNHRWLTTSHKPSNIDHRQPSMAPKELVNIYICILISVELKLCANQLIGVSEIVFIQYLIQH